jgi:hypothetical protein
MSVGENRRSRKYVSLKDENDPSCDDEVHSRFLHSIFFNTSYISFVSFVFFHKQIFE